MMATMGADQSAFLVPAGVDVIFTLAAEVHAWVFFVVVAIIVIVVVAATHIGWQ